MREKIIPLVLMVAATACKPVPPDQRVCEYLQSPDRVEVQLPLAETAGERMWGAAFVSDISMRIIQETGSANISVNVGPEPYHIRHNLGLPTQPPKAAMVRVNIEKDCTVTSVISQEKKFEFNEDFEPPRLEPFKWY